MINTIKKVVFWLVSHKDTLTTWAGGLMAFFIWLNQFLTSGNPFDVWTFIQALLAWFISYMVGKNITNTKKPV